MKISTRIHGVIDYSLAVLLIFSPWIFDFEGSTLHQWIAVSIGILVAVNNMITNYEFGVLRVLKMEHHLTADIFLATVLITSSWIFQTSGTVTSLFLLVSTCQAVTSFITSGKPTYRRTNNFPRLKIREHSH